MRQITEHNKQTGLAMIVAMLVLIALTLIVLSGSRNTTMQLRMASNMQSRVEALETSQAGLDYAVIYSSTDLTVKKPGNKICTLYHPDCTTAERVIDMPPPLDDSTTGPSNLLIVQEGRDDIPGSTIGTFEFTNFKVTSTFENTANGQGRAKLVSGIKRVTLIQP